MELEEYLTPQTQKAYERGILTLEEACRASAQKWMEAGDRKKFELAIQEADKAAYDADNLGGA